MDTFQKTLPADRVRMVPGSRPQANSPWPARELAVAQVVGKLSGGGVQRLAYNLAVGLHAQGARSQLIAMKSGNEQLTGLDPRLNITTMPPASAWNKPRYLLRLRRELLSGHIDVVHVHGQGCLLAVAMALAGVRRRRRPALWFTWHNSESVLEEKGIEHRLLLWALKRCDHVCGSSRQVVQKLTAALGTGGPDTVTVFQNGVPESPVTAGIDADEPLILWMARLVPCKNPAMLIRCAGRLRDEGLKFRIVLAGDPPPRQRWLAAEMQSLIQLLGLTEVVSMPGWIADTSSLICRGAIGVQTSETEGLSMALLEQMMAGLAVVATDVGDTALAIDADRNGLLVPPGNEEAMVAALRSVVTDRGQRRSLGQAARERALSSFSVAAMSRRAFSQYCAACGRG